MTLRAIEEIQAALQMRLQDEDGRAVRLKLLPPLSVQAINDMENLVGCPLPAELRELLCYCSGIDGLLETLAFDSAGLGGAFGLDEIFPNGLEIAHDGFGNYWLLDLSPLTTAVAPVYFACHDAPVILYQAPDLASFLHEVIRMHLPPHKSLVDDVHEDRLFQVWRKNPGGVDRETALQSHDPVVQEFAATLEGDWQIIDMREAPVGMGFSWGRYGPATELRRHGWHSIFAYNRPLPRRRFLKWITGR